MKFKALYILIVLFFTSGLLACGSSPEDLVKTGTLQIDSSVTVGDALEGYQYFDKTSWESFEDPQKRQIVQFNGNLDINQLAGANIEGMSITSKMIQRVKNKILEPTNLKLTYIAQFAISRNEESFSLKWSGIKVKGKQLKTGKKVDNNIPDTNFTVLQKIYNNEPEPYMLGLILSAGNQ